MKKIDVIIPLYKPGRELFALLDALLAQTVSVNRIILANTEEKYFEELVYGTDFADKYGKKTTVFHVSKLEFDHGGTRRLAVQRSDADFFVMMTQDAIPADENLLKELLEPLQQEQTAVSYARQLPAADCRFLERFTRSFNYPETSCVKTEADMQRLGIKTFFCSNVCAAYTREIYEQLGGFVKKTIFNEDMIYAAAAIKGGYHVAYAASAQVYHSHNYSGRQQFHRNFDLGVSQAQFPEVFAGLPSEKEGKHLVSDTTAYLKKQKKLGLLPGFYIQCFCKYAGYLLGKHYRSLPRFLVLKCTSNRAFWHHQDF